MMTVNMTDTVDTLVIGAGVIGLAIAQGLVAASAEGLRGVQNDLFDLGADLAVLEEDKPATGACRIEQEPVAALEPRLAALGEELGPLEEFILPGGSVSGATLHLARTVCRRAERVVVALSGEEAIGTQVIPYLTRLSDLLFQLARFQNKADGQQETCWKKKDPGKDQ